MSVNSIKVNRNNVRLLLATGRIKRQIILTVVLS